MTHGGWNVIDGV